MSRLFALILFAIAVSPAVAQEAKKEAPTEDKLFHRIPDPPFTVGDFTLQERSGKNVRASELLGKIWVTQFFYPGCNFCSKNTPTMQRLQEMYRGKADVRLVSIALNADSVETLTAFAADHKAEPDQWLFLTGPKIKVHEIVRLSFFDVALDKPDPMPGDSILHSMNLFLIDPHGRTVGFVVGTDAGAADALKTEIDKLRVRRRMEERIPITGQSLPWFNAILNSTCTILLLLGWIAIRMRYETLHKVLMLLALAVSMIFLSSYLFYHFVVLEAEPMRFEGEGTVRYVYFTILLTHTVLAITVAPLAIFITVQGLRNALASHKKVARWTLPIWLYVSVTGVVVYWMLYRVTW